MTQSDNNQAAQDTTQAQVNAQLEVYHIIDAARRLGVEMNANEAIQWLTAIAAAREAGQQVTVDNEAGVFGLNITMLDFDKKDLDRYRRIGNIVGIPPEENVETALSLSGSAAQSRVQLFPGDCDFFERVNIIAPTRAEACQRIGKVMRAKAIAKYRGSNYQFVEAKFGHFPADAVRNNERHAKGTSIAWCPEEVEKGVIECFTPEGQPLTIRWEEVAADPGWCKIDWLVAEPEYARVVSATNMLDVTWEAPDGKITPLDGFLDPYFQEVYLDAASIPLFTKLSKQVSPSALDNYVEQLRHEVRHYTREKPNYGKAAKRMYNIFRLTGRFNEAMFIRELFNEPAARLYQVWALLDTLEAATTQVNIDEVVNVPDIDALIKAVVESAEGPKESAIVMAMLKLRDIVAGRKERGEDWMLTIETTRADVAELVNLYFREKLYAIPAVAAFLAEFGEA
jgi:hypothetical protein